MNLQTRSRGAGRGLSRTPMQTLKVCGRYSSGLVAALTTAGSPYLAGKMFRSSCCLREYFTITAEFEVAVAVFYK